TATGFAAHLSSHLLPVQSFGITMAAGSFLVLVAMTLILPGGMLIGSHLHAPPDKPLGSRQVNQSLHHLTAWVLKHPRLIGVTTVVALALASAGLFRLRLETDF